MKFQKLLRGNYHVSLQTKLFLTFVALLMIVLCCFLVYVNFLVIKPLKAKTESDTQLAVAKVNDQLDAYVQNQNQLSQRILANKDVFAFLSERQDVQTIEGLTQNRKLRDFMFQAIGPSLSIQDMIIYDLNGTALASYIGYSTNPPSLRSFLESRTGSWTGGDYMLTQLQPGAVSFIRAIMNQDGEIFGYLCIQLDRSYLQRSVNGIANGEVAIVDGDGNIVAASSQLDIGQVLKNLPTVDGGSGLYADRQNYIAYHQSQGTGWTAYLITPRESVMGPVDSVKNISILLITALLLFSFLYIYISAKGILLPIRKLRGQILRINYSNMNVRVDSRAHNNDLIMLDEAFQELLERLQQSIENEKLALHEEVKARNSALQAQIAPHFIHNMLYLISIAAQEGKTDVVSDMCKHLSDSLRYVVSSPYQHVTLAEELAHIKNYLSLVGQKYEGDLEWEVDEHETFRHIQLPRLVIQPFVENCIEHAFSRSDPPWRIEVKVKLFNGLWAIEIRDNGDGFEPEKISEILTAINDSNSGAYELQHNRTGIGNMGVINTVNRLKLMYTNRLFFNVYNNTNGQKGATVQIIASLTKDFY